MAGPMGGCDALCRARISSLQQMLSLFVMSNALIWSILCLSMSIMSIFGIERLAMPASLSLGLGCQADGTSI